MRLHLVGGFLGSGKSTAILQAAQILVNRGRKVGIVTNEQGKHLVDTAYFQALNLPALEVTGGCICCHLDDFNERVDDLVAKYQPDVIFAESVGSCADLVATVLKPLLKLRVDFENPASLSVFADARLLYRFLKDMEMPFSDEVIYIFQKQLEEAELIVINKVDLLKDAQTVEIQALAGQRFPGKTFRLQNSLAREQVEDWLALLASDESPMPQEVLDIDYDRYAAGEAHFSWVDREFRLSLKAAQDWATVGDCVEVLCREFSGPQYRVAHLKMLLDDGETRLKCNLTALDHYEEKLAQFRDAIRKMHALEASLRINVMLEAPLQSVEDNLDKIIRTEFRAAAISYRQLSGFTRVPGYPKPTMRMIN